MRHDITMPVAQSMQGKVEVSWYKSTPVFEKQGREETLDLPWKVRVYRQTETTFVRGEDYHEFFLNSPMTQGELVFEGELIASNGRKFTITDTPPAFATTYTYYIQIDDKPPVGPVPVRHIDPEVYWSYDRLMQEVADLAAMNSPSVPVEMAVCGHTATGRDMPCVRIGKQGPRLALVGLIHPGESGPELIVTALKQLVKHQPALFENAQVLAIPSVNIDMREKQAQGVPWYLRTTITGVDLNRNFPASWDEPALGYGLDSRDPHAITYRGPAPASAPETKAVMAAMESTPPDVVLSYHALASLCSLPMLYPVKAADDDSYGQRCIAVGKAFAQGGFSVPDFDPKWVRPGCTQGSLALWVYQRFNAPALDLEIGATDSDIVKRACEDRVDIELLGTYQKKHEGAIASVLQSLASA